MRSLPVLHLAGVTENLSCSKYYFFPLFFFFSQLKVTLGYIFKVFSIILEGRKQYQKERRVSLCLGGGTPSIETDYIITVFCLIWTNSIQFSCFCLSHLIKLKYRQLKHLQNKELIQFNGRLRDVKVFKRKAEKLMIFSVLKDDVTEWRTLKFIGCC